MTAPLVFDAVAFAGSASPLFSLTLAAGETVALVGDADAGLARLADAALGLEPPRAGTVRLLGTDVAGLPERARLAFRRRVGYLPAGGGLLQNLSLRDNVALPLRFGSDAPEPEIETRVRVLLAAVRLGAAAERRPAAASDEERRRAALARALAFDPPLVILEHPFEGLPHRVASELLDTARGGETAAGARRAVLLTATELPPAIARRCDRVLRRERGGALVPEPA